MASLAKPPLPPFDRASARQKGGWFRSYGNNDVAIGEHQRRIFGPRPRGDATELTRR